MTSRSKDLQPWIDIQLEEGATVDHPALKQLSQKLDLHPVILKELTSPSPRAHVENFGSYLFLAVQFPIYDAKNFVSRRAEIDFIIRRDVVITVHYEHLHALEFAANQGLAGKERQLPVPPGLEITYGILSHVLAYNQRQLRHIQEKVEAVGSDLFTGSNQDLLVRIAYLKRDISEYKIIFNPMGQVLTSLQGVGASFFGEGTAPYIEDIHGDFLRISQQIDDYRTAVADFEQTNNQLMSMRSGQVIRVLTVVSLITYPLTLFATLFAVRLEGIPFMGHPQGFWVLGGMVLATVIALIALFKAKKWI